MASTLYASHNEPDWGERKVYMRKNPNPNPPAETTTSSSNPNPRPYTGAATPNHHRGESLAGAYVTFNIASYSRSELRDLKRRLASELDRVRGLASWIESRHASPGHRSASGSSGGGHQERDATSSSASRPPALRQPPTADAPRQIKGEIADAGKKLSSGNKRPPPSVPSSRESKRPAPAGSDPGSLMKKCGQILMKLMKHKHGWVFNEPVDTVAMGLHDYHIIVKRPMDLGTVKSKLDANAYISPMEFATDVRLTFNNALLYNPKGHDVYIMAEQLLRLFEDLFGPAKEKFEKHRRAMVKEQEMEKHRNQIHIPEPSNRIQTHPSIPAARAPPAVPTPAKPDPPQPRPDPAAAARALASPVPPHPQQISPPLAAAKPVMAKQPKPKARDPHKREMSFKEKQKLSQDLQSIPDEKMDQIIQIVRKRNPDPALDGNEIELDFEALDTETLWELDRFVGNCKKMMNKMKRQEAISASAVAAPAAPPPPKIEEKVPVVTVGETTPEVAAVKKNRRQDAGEEDVDIGDDMPSTHFPPVEIEKDDSSSSGGSSTSGSSSSSSSSDSDSRSSSGSDTDGDEAQSPAVGLRPPIPRA